LDTHIVSKWRQAVQSTQLESQKEKKMKKIALGMTASLLFMSFLTGAYADPKADEIVKLALDRKSPQDMTSVSTMTITDRTGVVKVRKLKSVSKETAEGTKSYTEFIEPADVVGTKFLTVSKKGSETDQRIYLPALKKVRRISSSSKDGEFMGSDLNYFDMEKRYFEDGTYTLLAEDETLDAVPGVKLAKINTVYKDPNAPYSKAISWIDPSNGIAYKTEMYDKKDGALLKIVIVEETKTLKGYLLITKSTISNVKKGSKTVSDLGDVTVDTGVKDADVSLKRLEQ
jgi:hypothetical protein